MIVDISHRKITNIHSKADYETLYQSFVENVRTIETVSSIILCGSLAKNDIVEGWSDIDIIVFCSQTIDSMFLNKFKNAVDLSKKGFEIGLGIDLVNEKEFFKSKRFGGRPLAMTYEVAAYGKISYGINFLSDINYDSQASNYINFERKTLVFAEIHSWRRQYLMTNDNLHQLFFNTTKSLLRILQSEVGPVLELPINSQNNLNRFRKLYPDHPSIDAIEKAVYIRKHWIDFMKDDNLIDKELVFLIEAVTTYPVLYG